MEENVNYNTNGTRQSGRDAERRLYAIFLVTTSRSFLRALNHA